MSEPAAGGRLSRSVTVVNQRGLHARASASLVRRARTFDAEIHVERDGQEVGATSIMGLLMLAASCGTRLVLHASGPDARAALDALEQLFADGFGEEA